MGLVLANSWAYLPLGSHGCLSCFWLLGGLGSRNFRAFMDDNFVKFGSHSAEESVWSCFSACFSVSLVNRPWGEISIPSPEFVRCSKPLPFSLGDFLLLEFFNGFLCFVCLFLSLCRECVRALNFLCIHKNSQKYLGYLCMLVSFCQLDTN